jgi:hypothetical protein
MLFGVSWKYTVSVLKFQICQILFTKNFLGCWSVTRGFRMSRDGNFVKSVFFLCQSACSLTHQFALFVSYIIQSSDVVALKLCESIKVYGYVALKRLNYSWVWYRVILYVSEEHSAPFLGIERWLILIPKPWISDSCCYPQFRVLFGEEDVTFCHHSWFFACHKESVAFFAIPWKWIVIETQKCNSYWHF